MGQLIHPDSLAVHAYIAEGSAVHLVDLRDLSIAGVLHSVTALPAEKLDQHVIEILRASAHHDAAGIGLQSPKLAQVSGDGLAQLQHAVVGDRLQQFRPTRRDLCAGELGPDREGKLGGLQMVGGEVHLIDRLRGQWG